MKSSTIVSKIYPTNSNGLRRLFQLEKIMISTHPCPNACEMRKSIERLKQGESINVQDLETNLYWEFGKFTSRDGESLELYYSRMVKNEVNEIRAERLARTANPLALVAQQQPVYHPQNHPNHYIQNSSTRPQPTPTINRCKAILNSPPPTYDQEPTTVADNDEMSKEKEIDKLMALISLSFKKIYKPTNNNLRTLSNTSTQVMQQSGIQCCDCKEYRHVAKEFQKPKWAKDAAYHKEKMLLFKQEEAGFEYYYADYMNAILGIYTTLDEFTDLQCDYVDQVVKCEGLEIELSRSNTTSKSFEALQKHAINLELALQQSQLQDKGIAISELKKLIDIMKGKSVETKTRKPIAVPISTREPKRNVNQSVATSYKKTVATESIVKKPRSIIRKLYEQVTKTCRNASRTANILEPMTPRCSNLSNAPFNFVEKFLGTVKFGNDQIPPILGYGDLVQGTITIKRVYYVEGLNHNLFSVGQFCDADLEVAFWKSTCYIRDFKGNNLLTGSCGTNLYSITLQETSTPNPICLMAKATSSQAWLWHRRLSHLNFDTINLHSKNDIVSWGKPKEHLFVKDQLCSSCELRKAKRTSFHTKTTSSSKRRLQLLHMELCGPMRIESINGKKYVLVIVDDYSRYTRSHFLRSKDETPDVLIDFPRLVQRGLHAQVRTVLTDKGTEFLNKTFHAYLAQEGIEHQTSTARTPEQNGVVERWNCTLVEAARTMLSAAKVPLFFCVEAIATTCFT
ncbi:retrovirus-related pol polyprotein from transposon TNT 1-94 [Tanacetum coccineum]